MSGACARGACLGRLLVFSTRRYCQVGGASSIVNARKTRLDVLLVARGLAESREKAQALILAGNVQVAGHSTVKAGMQLRDDVEIRVAAPEHPWVSRGGGKLAH